MKFHPLRVIGVERAAEDAACVTLEVPDALRETFAHQAGQYVSVQHKIGHRDELRTYSIVSAPGQRALKLGIRLQSGGRMSQQLGTRLKPGDTLSVGAPMGRFRTSVSPQREFSYVAFAAGSGITPILSLANDILAEEPRSRFTLIYGNRSISRSMFLEDILALKNRYMDRMSLHFLMSREPQQTELLNGRIDGPKVLELARHISDIAEADEYLVCGPGDMVDSVRDALQTLNAGAAVRFERFTAAGSAGADNGALPLEAGTQTPAAAAAETRTFSSSEPAPAPAPQAVLAMISVVMDGRRRSFPMAPTDASVLDAAERAGLELPFSCRAGICATCRTRITEGAAVMAHNIALQDWEVAAGFLLCCQARPTTASLEISYDLK